MTQIESTPKPRRNVELVLLILALGVGIGANALVGVDREKAFDTDFWFQSGLLTAAALAFHLVLRIRAKYADPVILPLVVALNGLGLAMIHRLDRVGEDTGNNQLRWTLVAMAVAIAVIWFLKDHRILRRFTYISLAVSAVLLILPLVPGISAGEILGAKVWIRIGSMTFQPGEIAKITLAIFFAGYLSSNRDLILLAGRKMGPLQFPRFKDMGPMIAAWLVSIGVLIFQRDLGSSILFFGLFLVMIYVATSRISWVIIGLVLISVGGFVASRVFSHVALRIDGWINAFTDEVYGRQFGGSLQIVEGLFGMANGGLVGTGLGQGRPNLVPFANSDMIIASFGEELGLIGALRHRPDVPAAVHPGLPRRARHPGRVRQAAGLRPFLRDRAAVLCGDRRRYPADPADRPHDAVPRRRRLLAPGQLDHRRPAADDFAHGARSGGHNAAAARPGTERPEGNSPRCPRSRPRRPAPVPVPTHPPRR